MSKKNKTIQLTVSIARNDLERKARQAASFREKGLGVQVKLKLRGREESRTGEAMKVLNEFVGLTTTPENKVNGMKWNNSTLETFLHP